MSPPSKRSTCSTGKAPDIALLPNGKIPQAPKPRCKTRQCQSKDTDKDIESDRDECDKTPPHLPSQPHHNKTPAPPSLQPCQPPPLQLPSPSTPIVRDPGCMPSGSDFEATTAAEQLAISRMRPGKRPISQESLDKEDDEAFKEGVQAEKLQAQSTKGKKSKGKKSNVKGPFKSGPIPKQAKQCAFAIHANFEKQIQDLAAEISKAPQLLFSLVGEGPLLSHHALTRWGAFKVWYGVHGEIKKPKNMSPQDWTKLVSDEHTKYCKDNLGDEWEDPEALATLFEPIMAWHVEKHKTYVEDLKLEGTFDKVIGKAERAFRYHGFHCFGFIVNLQPNHTGCTSSAMWGATPAFERMMIDKKGVISQQIAEWETLLRRADMTLNSNAKEHEKELWTVPITGNGRDHARRAFLAWLGRDIGKSDPSHA
ncbi:hypothetical protein DXG01_005514 [Tephrocybe rancida]|nr:hypothetical protein DXG01_005514 [Tephrocybe rancida]